VICSVIIPCLNEARFIGRCLDSILANDIPAGDYEVLVADGMSTDGTRAILDGYAARHRNVRILDNPGRSTPAGLNLAIRQASAPIIIRIDAHSTVDSDYIRRCLETLEATGADNVGGKMLTHPMSAGRWSSAITSVLSHRFGVGNSVFRTHTSSGRWVDTVFGGCYRRDVFSRIGCFNEQLRRGQDMEFNRRLTAAGGRIWFEPAIVTHYYARADLRSFTRHNWANGVWAIYPFVYSDVVPVSLRHLVPLFFVSGLIASAIAALIWHPALWLLAALVASYVALATGAAIQVAVERRDPLLTLTMPATFFMLHTQYGLGSLWAVGRLLFEPAAWAKLWAWCRSRPRPARA
jgi:succinoglycan biosynthesis protein ExoA